jgi:hypothetical protein
MVAAISMGFILYKESGYANVHFLTYDFSGWNIGHYKKTPNIL